MDDFRYNLESSGCTSSHCINLQEINRMPLLGLPFVTKESFLNLLESRLRKLAPDSVGSQHQPMSEKLKASNFPITTISVGNWQRVSKHEGELTAKLYFAKRKLVWEFLDGQLKSKMEVSWSDITAIQAVMQPDQPGYLQIELGNPPLFFREITPQPRKHTNWQQASDFTGGQAPLYRRHFAMFPPGALDKHYEKLLQCDQHLNQLSRRPFPTHQSPYFSPPLPLQFSISGLTESFHHPQMQQHPPPSLHPTPYPTITAAARNSGVAAAVWGNQINSEATYVNSSRQNQQRVLPCHQQHYVAVETALPYMEIPPLNQMNHNIPSHSYLTNYGPSDEMQSIAAAGDDDGWSLLDVIRQNGGDGNWLLGEQVMNQNAVGGGADSWLASHIQADDNSCLAPHIQGSNYGGVKIDADNISISRNLYHNQRFTKPF